MAGALPAWRHCVQANGVLREYGLSPEGQHQALNAGRRLAGELSALDSAALHVHASPFSRTRETAVLAVSALGEAWPGVDVQVAPALRERFFGAALELRDHGGYSQVWEVDAGDAAARPGGDGESVQDVAARLTELLQELEALYAGPRPVDVLLVSHGDTLSILQALVAGAPLGAHRSFGLGTAELRRLDLGPRV